MKIFAALLGNLWSEMPDRVVQVVHRVVIIWKLFEIVAPFLSEHAGFDLQGWRVCIVFEQFWWPDAVPREIESSLEVDLTLTP